MTAPVPSALAGHHGGGWSPAYHLIRLENRAPSRLPEFGPDAEACLLTTPRGRGTRWGAYLLSVPGGAHSEPIPSGLEHFVYVLAGTVALEAGADAWTLSDAGAFAYVPPDRGFRIVAAQSAELFWLKRRYAPIDAIPPPAPLTGARDDVEEVEDPDVPGSYDRVLLPANRAFDFTMKLLSFDPGIAFHQVEIHDEDHGIYFTAGGGVYLLDTARHEVATGDFIYLAPYCPQHFVATGDVRAEYLLYKPAHRDGFLDS